MYVDQSNNSKFKINGDGTSTFEAQVYSSGFLADTPNTTSSIVFRGKDPDGNATTTVKADGSASFAGVTRITTETGSPVSGIAKGVEINPSGRITCASSGNTENDMVFSGFAVGSIDATSRIYSDGSAVFDGRVQTENTTIENAFGYTVLKTDSAGFWSPDDWYFGPDVSDPSSVVITLDADNGNATFAGQVDIGNDIASASGTRIYKNGALYIRGDVGASSSCFKYYNGGFNDASTKINFLGDGSAEFAGRVRAKDFNSHATNPSAGQGLLSVVAADDDGNRLHSLTYWGDGRLEGYGPASDTTANFSINL